MRPLYRALIVIIGTASGASAQTSTQGNVDAALTSAYAKFSDAYRRADAQAVAALYTDDAWYLSPGKNIERGHSFVLSEFQRYLGRYQAGAGPGIAFKVIDRVVSGDLAHDIGYIYMNDQAPASEKDPPSAKFAVLWQRSANGEWKILSDTYNDVSRQPDPARAAAEQGVRKAVQAYFDGVTNHDAARLEVAFHPQATLSTTAPDGDINRVAFADWKKFASQPAGSTAGKHNRIASIQLMGNAAVVTTVLDWPTVRYVDYLSLVKQGEDWKIVSKIWHTEKK